MKFEYILIGTAVLQSIFVIFGMTYSLIAIYKH